MGMVTDTSNKYQVSRAQAIYILVVLTVLFFLNYADRYVLAAVLQPMKIALGLNDTEVGLVQSAFNVGVGLLSIPMSFVIERWSRRKTIGLLAIIWSIGTLATGFCTKFIQLIFTRAAVGIGEAGYATGGASWLSVVFPKERRGRVLGIYGIGPALGAVAGLILGGLIATKTGDWRMAFYYFAIPGVIFGILAFFLKDYATVKDKGETALNKKYLGDWIRLFKIKAFTFTLLGQMFFQLYYFTFLGWLPSFLMRGYNMDAGQAGAISGAAFLLTLISSPLGGWLADKWQKHNRSGRAYLMVVMQALNLILTGALLFAFGGPLSIFIIILVVQSFVVCMNPPLITTLTTDVIPIKFRATGYGLAYTFYYFVGMSLGPWLVGLISDASGGGATGLKNGFLLTLPALALAVIFFIINSKYYATDSERCSDQVLAE
ncbi:MAG: MFS transporter [Dehalococcoidia bacterium]